MNVYMMLTDAGNPAKNQYVIDMGNGKKFLKSYNSIVAYIDESRDGGYVRLGRDWNYSTTTTKFVKKFTGRTLEQLRYIEEHAGTANLSIE